MATQTTHYNLTKPDLTDLVDVTVLNDNADIIDQAIYEASQSGGAAMIESSVEATTTSAHAYVVGDHFIYNNTLYAVTAAIAVGDTITPGTNCTATTVAGELEGKVDKVTGKQLSTEDYTTAEKEKLEGIAAGAEANVQSDWNQADSTADDYIKNRTHYAVPAWTQKISADLHPISGESMRKLCGQGTAGVQTLTNGKLYKVTLGTKVWTGYPTKYTWTAYEYAYVLETDIGLTFEDEYDDNPSWAGWKAYITTGSAVDLYAHLTIEENSGENVTKLDNKYLDMDSAPASGSAKPVTSGGVYTALTGKISTTAKGAANGVASLDSSGKVPSGQLPSYVDDVIEGYYYNGAFYSDSAHTQEITGETGKIYVDLSTEDSYRWSGSVYVKIANQIEIDATLTQQGEAADAKAVGDAVGELRNSLNHKADVIYDTASGDIASFPDGADGLPVKALTVAIEPVQDTSGGDPSPTHICPISGWTGCNISHSGADTSDPTVIPITFPSGTTVYGGTLDVTSGVLTVDRAEVDLGTLTWWKANSAFQVPKSTGINPPALGGTGCKLLCSNYKYESAAVDKTMTQTNGYIRIYDSSYSDAETFKTAMSGVQLVYELATPQTYQLDPVTVNTLLGQNNVWSDTGSSTVEYPADTKLYIQKINTPTDDDMIADANIASGKYFIVNNNLYISTAAILAGDPIKPGTNCTLTNLAAALNALNS